jgi:hypothetical protein
MMRKRDSLPMAENMSAKRNISWSSAFLATLVLVSDRIRKAA